MRNRDERELPTLMRRSAGVLGLVAVYLVMFGAGSQLWPVSVAGGAAALLGVLLAVTAILWPTSWSPLFVYGTARVVSVSPPPSTTHGRCDMLLVVDAARVPSVAVRVRVQLVPTGKWPEEGDTLPVRLARSDPRRLKVLWDQVRPRTTVPADAQPIVEHEYGDVYPDFGDPPED